MQAGCWFARAWWRPASASAVHLSIDGWRIKTVPSRLSAVDLARLRHMVPARQDRRQPGTRPVSGATSCVEVQRLVNAWRDHHPAATRLIQVGSPLAGQRARIRLDGQLMHVITQDGILWRTLPCPIPPGQRHRLQGVRLAGPDPSRQPAVTVQRRVSSRGGIQVARQRIQVGITHAGKIVTVAPTLTPSGGSSTATAAARPVPRTTTGEISRFKAYATRQPQMNQGFPDPPQVHRAFTASTSYVLALRAAGAPR